MTLRLLAVCLCLLTPARGFASGFSDLIVFGDSLSDQGNTDAATLGFFPGGEYFEGRFSNGPVYAELLAERLGLGSIERSGLGGNNFAFGGAETAGPSGFEGLFLNGVDEQVDAYLDRQTPNADALHIVWAGANDLLAGINPPIPASNIAGEIAQLHAAGAREFLVINLPDLGVTPRFNTTAQIAADYTQLTDSFNAELNLALDDVEMSLVDIRLRRFDVDAVFDDLIADPSRLGLTNTTAAALNLSAPNPNEFLFFDELHPTAPVHALLADRLAESLLALPSDANGDQLVNAADFTTLRDTSADALRFAELQENFGAAAAETVRAITVPEPGGASLCCFAVALLASLRRRAENR